MSAKRTTGYEIEYGAICSAKGIKATAVGVERYITAISSLYHAVCLDIDGTLTYKNAEEKKAIVKVLGELTNRNVIMCFITGRGKSNAFEFLDELKRAIMGSDERIDSSQFRRWYCVTNNGYMLYSNDFLSERGFLTRSSGLVDSSVKAEYIGLKSKVQNEVAELLSTRLGIDKQIILSDSNASIGENSLRFPFPPALDERLDDALIEEIRDVVRKKTNHGFGVNRGVYHKNNKIVVEISMTTKGRAIDRVEEHLGIPKNKMVRVGDQGDSSGNDFEMLNCNCGFSVGKFSKSANACYPVARRKTILAGVEATAELLSKLRIFPTICLEKPSEELYLPKLAKSESKNIIANRATDEYYENLLKSAFRNSGSLFLNVWDYMDERTGGFYIHDWEYTLLKAENPDHLLFKIFDIKLWSDRVQQPRLQFALKTDNGILLRGPMNYYYGLSFRSDSGDNLTKGFLKRLNQCKIYFFKTCIQAIKTSQPIDMRDSIIRRVLLGIMDSIRDYLLTLINIHLQERVGNKDALYLSVAKDADIHKLYTLAKNNLINMYDCLFDNVDANFVKSFIDFLQNKILVIARSTEGYIDKLTNYEYKKGCRVWREIDSFYENVIAIDTSIKNLLYKCDVDGKEILLYGIRYGSLELPIIAAMLFETKYQYHNIRHSIGAICLKSNYRMNHEGELDATRPLSTINRRKLYESKFLHILMDDNLVTGRTLQIAVNMLVNRGIFPHKIFVVRYPALNRIKHMFLPSHGAPDTDLFWEFVYGLTSPTPYVRLNHSHSYVKNKDDKYLDELGQFNKTRTFVLNILFKNGIFAPTSEVSNRGV